VLFDSLENWKSGSNVALTWIGGLDNTLPCVSSYIHLLLVITEGNRRRLFLSVPQKYVVVDRIRYLFSVKHLVAVYVMPQV
jgi:hypothetical protein